MASGVPIGLMTSGIILLGVVAGLILRRQRGLPVTRGHMVVGGVLVIGGGLLGGVYAAVSGGSAGVYIAISAFALLGFVVALSYERDQLAQSQRLRLYVVFAIASGVLLLGRVLLELR